MRPRLLVPLTLHFSVRYLLRTGLLASLRDDAVPVIAVSWDDPELESELEAIGCEVHRLPAARTGTLYGQCRSRLNVWHFARLASPSTAIDNRRANLQRTVGERLRRDARLRWYRMREAMPGGVERVLADERRAIESDTNIAVFRDLVRDLRPDGVLSLTPFLPDEELLLRAAAEQGIPLCAAILSFDNITTRGWIPVTFDTYLLWNKYNVGELERAYPDSASSTVTVVGAPQFDFYSDRSYIWDERQWRRIVGVPLDRPVILYGGGARTIVPHEPLFVRHLDDAISRGDIPGHPVVLFRRHPIDPPARWEAIRRTAQHVVFDEPWEAVQGGGHVNIRRIDIERLASTLRHSAVHVNVSSTLAVDGAIFDRPQVGPAYDDGPRHRYDRVTRELYLREHFLPITRSGGLDVATSAHAMIDAVASGLSDPSANALGRRRLVDEICTFNDGQATSRVVTAVRAFLNQNAADRRAKMSLIAGAGTAG